jgi:hypothetical protein
VGVVRSSSKERGVTRSFSQRKEPEKMADFVKKCKKLYIE